MGLQMGLNGSGQFCKRKFRWLFKIHNIAGDFSSRALPPLRSQRPNVSFSEMQVNHLSETIFYPAKPTWQPVQIALYDLKRSDDHPVFEWLKEIYNPESGEFHEPNKTVSVEEGLIKQCSLELYDGIGSIVEKWTYEDCWPQAVDFGALDMGDPDIATCELTLRYSRAYLVDSSSSSSTRI